MIESGLFLIDHHRRNYLFHVAYLTTGTHDDRTRRDDFLAAGILLAHGQGIFSGRHVDFQSTTEIGQSLYTLVQTGIFAFLRAARPHPVGRERHAVQPFGQRCPYDIGQRFGHRKHGTCGRVGQTGLGGMPDSGSDTGLATVIQSHDTAVAQRQLDFTLALLACHFARHGTVYFIGQPILTSHGLQTQYTSHVFIQLGFIIRHVLILTLHRIVAHVRLRTVAEHLRHIQIKRTHAIGLLESKVRVAGRFTDHEHRCTLAFGYLTHVFDMFFLNQQSHAFLRFVGYDFLRRQSLVANRQFGHIYQSTALFHQLGETVHMSGRTVVVNGNHRIHVLFAQCTHQIVGTLLHLGIRTLHGIQFDAGRITSRIYRRNRTAAQTDTVVIAAYHYDLVAFLRRAFQAVALRTVSHASGQHDHLVITVTFTILLMLESQYGTGNQRLPEFVSEIGSPVRRLDQNLFRSLVQPLAHRQDVLPITFLIRTRIRSHVNRRPGYRP